MSLEITGAIVHVQNKTDKEDTALTSVDVERFLNKEQVAMETLLVTLVLVGLLILIIVGVVVSVRLYVRGELGVGRFRRVRRVRTRRPIPGGTAIEETIEETIDEELPVEV